MRFNQSLASIAARCLWSSARKRVEATLSAKVTHCLPVPQGLPSPPRATRHCPAQAPPPPPSTASRAPHLGSTTLTSSWTSRARSSAWAPRRPPPQVLLSRSVPAGRLSVGSRGAGKRRLNRLRRVSKRLAGSNFAAAEIVDRSLETIALFWSFCPL